MPIYEFECDDCGNRFDRLQKLSDPDPDTCPDCGRPVHRCVTAPSFRLAGSGWYETDFKGAGDKKHNLADKRGAGATKSAEPVKESAKSSGSASATSSASTTTSTTAD